MSTTEQKLIALCRELARDAHGAPFRCAVGFVMKHFNVDQTTASALLRHLERRGILICVRRGLKDTAEQKGTATLWKFREQT
jgi:DNA-binding MarR family transcriptional regulator